MYLKKYNHFNHVMQPGSKNRKECPILAIIYDISDDNRLLQTFLGAFRPKLNSCDSNKFFNSVCLCKGWIFMFFRGGEKISGKCLAVNGVNWQVGGGRRWHLQGEGKF